MSRTTSDDNSGGALPIHVVLQSASGLYFTSITTLTIFCAGSVLAVRRGVSSQGKDFAHGRAGMGAQVRRERQTHSQTCR